MDMLHEERQLKAFYKSTPEYAEGTFSDTSLGRVTTVPAETVLQDQVENAPALGGGRPYLLWHTL